MLRKRDEDFILAPGANNGIMKWLWLQCTISSEKIVVEELITLFESSLNVHYFGVVHWYQHFSYGFFVGAQPYGGHEQYMGAIFLKRNHQFSYNLSELTEETAIHFSD